jgi:hypothetical protein
MTYIHCPHCGKMVEYTHRDGLPVCRCPTQGCPGAERWLEYDDFIHEHTTTHHEENTVIDTSVNTLVEERKKAEQEIASFIAGRINALHDLVGLYPQDVSLTTTAHTTSENGTRTVDMMLFEVSIKFDL